MQDTSSSAAASSLSSIIADGLDVGADDTSSPEGPSLGSAEAAKVGSNDGDRVGTDDWSPLGVEVGCDEGLSLGMFDGSELRAIVGSSEMVSEGSIEMISVGSMDIAVVGSIVGWETGDKLKGISAGGNETSTVGLVGPRGGKVMLNVGAGAGPGLICTFTSIEIGRGIIISMSFSLVGANVFGRTGAKVGAEVFGSSVGKGMPVGTAL